LRTGNFVVTVSDCYKTNTPHQITIKQRQYHITDKQKAPSNLGGAILGVRAVILTLNSKP
jgi:hypothetical protein